MDKKREYFRENLGLILVDCVDEFVDTHGQCLDDIFLANSTLIEIILRIPTS